jgi:hypothetical protein
MSKFNVKFHGVRGSIPGPLGNEELEEKLIRAFQAADPEIWPMMTPLGHSCRAYLMEFAVHMAATLLACPCRSVTNG